MAFISMATTIAFMVFAFQQSFQTSFDTNGNPFHLEIRGHRFEENIAKTVKGSSLTMCASACHHFKGCNSFQYHKAMQPETDAICELLELGNDNRVPSMNRDFNIYSRLSHETTTLAPTATMKQRMTPAQRNCPDISDQLLCTYNQAMPKRTLECALKSNVDTKIVMYIDDNLSWDDSMQFCTDKEQHLLNVKDLQYECTLTSIFYKMCNMENLQNKDFTVGLHKNANENWKFADDTDVTDFPEFYAGPGPENTDITDELCGFVTLEDWKMKYRATPCDVNTEGVVHFNPVCTTA